MMCEPSRNGKYAGIAFDCRAGAVQPRRMASSATQSPSAVRPVTSRPAASKAARTSPSRSTKIPDASRTPPGRSSSPRPAASGTSSPAIRLARTTSNGRLAAGQAALACAEAADQGVPARVGDRRLDRDRIGVEPQRAGGAELERGDREDPRAAPDVEHARAREDPAVGQRLDPGQAEPGRRMEAGPERHPRVEREDDIVGRAAVAPPGRADDQPAADPHDREVRLPGVGPVGLLDDPRAQLADRTQPERLEMTERLGHLGSRPFGGGPVASREIGTHDRRPARIEPRAETLVDQLERRLDRRPAGRRATEDLADRLDRLDVRLDRQLQPRARRRRSLAAASVN